MDANNRPFVRTPGMFEYKRADGAILAREYDTPLSNGMRTSGHWVYRDANRDYIDHDEFLSNVLQRNGVIIDVN